MPLSAADAVLRYAVRLHPVLGRRHLHRPAAGGAGGRHGRGAWRGPARRGRCWRTPTASPPPTFSARSNSTRRCRRSGAARCTASDAMSLKELVAEANRSRAATGLQRMSPRSPTESEPKRERADLHRPQRQRPRHGGTTSPALAGSGNSAVKRSFARFDDGELVRWVFRGMLIGTIFVLGMDLRDLYDRNATAAAWRLPKRCSPVLPPAVRNRTSRCPPTRADL